MPKMVTKIFTMVLPAIMERFEPKRAAMVQSLPNQTIIDFIYFNYLDLVNFKLINCCYY